MCRCGRRCCCRCYSAAAAADAAAAVRKFTDSLIVNYYTGPKSKIRHGSLMQNILINMCKKFHYDRLRNDRTLWNRKYDNNKNRMNNNKNKNNGGRDTLRSAADATWHPENC